MYSGFGIKCWRTLKPDNDGLSRVDRQESRRKREKTRWANAQKIKSGIYFSI
jgi:hypothetical protein